MIAPRLLFEQIERNFSNNMSDGLANSREHYSAKKRREINGAISGSC